MIYNATLAVQLFFITVNERKIKTLHRINEAAHHQFPIFLKGKISIPYLKIRSRKAYKTELHYEHHFINPKVQLLVKKI